MIRILPEPAAFLEACAGARDAGLRVGLVPTMGALHDGHLALVREAKRRAGFVAATIFVNPTQFGPNEDLARYPRDLEADVAKLDAAGADVVFTPTPEGMYPKGDETRVRVGATAEPLCGRFRPGHFEGVCTVVTKLFALAGPCVAVFGRKDYQQLTVIRRMTTDLLMPIEIIGMATVRETDGLAMSSRNRYLDAEGRAKALSLVTGLRAAVKLFSAGERNAGALRAAARGPVEAAARSIDYVEIADSRSLAVYDDGSKVGDRALVAIAAHVGTTRLIDNVVLGEERILGVAKSPPGGWRSPLPGAGSWQILGVRALVRGVLGGGVVPGGAAGGRSGTPRDGWEWRPQRVLRAGMRRDFAYRCRSKKPPEVRGGKAKVESPPATGGEYARQADLCPRPTKPANVVPPAFGKTPEDRRRLRPIEIPTLTAAGSTARVAVRKRSARAPRTVGVHARRVHPYKGCHQATNDKARTAPRTRTRTPRSTTAPSPDTH
jgi:pantoate--beta-alanine ligase